MEIITPDEGLVKLVMEIGIVQTALVAFKLFVMLGLPVIATYWIKKKIDHRFK